MNSRTALILAALVFCLMPSPATACSCIRSLTGTPPCLAFGGADVVFLGSPVAVSDHERIMEFDLDDEGEEVLRESWPGKKYLFAVDEGFKGVEEHTVEIFTGRGGGDCGHVFEIGKSYFVYAGRDEETGELSFWICGRTGPAARAANDLAYARRLKELGALSSIYGVAQVFERDSAEEYGGYEGISGAVVRAEGVGGKVYSSVADAEGRFEIELPSGGSYLVNGIWGEDQPSAEPMRVLVDTGSCAPVGLFVDSLASITGTVLTAGGDPPDYIGIDLVPAPGDETPNYDFTGTEENGSFKFAHVVPGDYRVVVERYPGADEIMLVYYPGTENADEAMVVTVRSGEKVDLGLFQLPPSRADPAGGDGEAP